MQPTGKDEPTSSYRKILGLALPVGLETVFQTSLGAVDQVIVGFLGASAVGGVGLSNSVSFIVMLVYSAIGIGSGVLIAQAFGRKNMDPLSKKRRAQMAMALAVLRNANHLETALPGDLSACA